MRLLYFVLLLLCSAYHSTAQTYYPMPMQNARWYQDESGRGFSDVYSLITRQDTLINGLNYTTLEKHYGYNPQSPNNTGTYIGAMREDNRVVYFYHRDSSQEMVLYDFNAQLGDTVSGWYGMIDISVVPCIAPQTCTVSDVDSIQDCNGNYRRRIRVYEAWVAEGIGASTGLFAPLMEVMLDQGYYLHCAYQNDSAVYAGNDCIRCSDTTIAIRAATALNQPTQFYPNPASERLFFDVGGEANDEYTRLELQN